VFTIDAALQHTCAGFREHAARGEITANECDLLIDGAIMLAVHLEALVEEPSASSPAAARQPKLSAARRRTRHRRS
jgi:hypothetical protein